jgi:hypothetical protein
VQAGRCARRFEYAVIGALAVASVATSRARAQEQPAHDTASQHHAASVGHGESSALIKAVREALERFRDPSRAMAEGYAPMLGCVSGPDRGAMGVHFVNGSLVGDGALDVALPEALVYEPTSGGGFRLVAAEYIALADMWNAKNAAPPELMGQLFHLTESPNRFGLPAFYALHVWAWRDNPSGSFVNWNPKVSCDAFDPHP